MKRYMLLPEDSIELLRAQDEAEAAVCVFCERTMILLTSPRTGCIRSIAWSFLHATRCLRCSRRF